MNSRGTLATVEALIKQMGETDQATLFEHLRENYPEQLGPIAVENSAETATEPAASQPDTITLSPEQQRRAGSAKAAMAERFEVSEDEFSVVRTSDNEGNDIFTVVYDAGAGINFGGAEEAPDKERTWDSIFDPARSERFMVEVNGRIIDTRLGMTREVYEAFIMRARLHDAEPMPDSPALSKESDEGWTSTWLTGETAIDTYAPAAYTNLGRDVVSGWYRRVSGGPTLRFRPAITIE